MAKPPPTRIKSKAPVSLAPVKALNAGADRKLVAVQPATTAAPVPTPPASKPAEAPKPAAAAPAAVASKPERIARPRLRAEKPKAEPAQRRASAPAAKPDSRQVSEHGGKLQAAAAPAAAASAPVEKAVAAPPAIVAEPAVVIAETASTAVRTVAEASAPKAPVAPVPLSLGQLPPPRLPEVAALTGETLMSQALTMARAFGALQAKMVDHACQEFRATVSDAEKLVRSDSASEAVTLQAKAVRRSYESYAEHLKELARIANAALKKG